MPAVGVRQRHGNGCKQPASGCRCPWQAEVYSARDKKKIRKLFPTKAAAKGWRAPFTQPMSAALFIAISSLEMFC